MNALSTSILLYLVVMVLFASKRGALLSIIAGTLFLTQGNSVEIMGCNIFAVRFIEVAGFIRVVGRKEFIISNLNKVDKIFLIFYLYVTLVFVIRSDENQIYVISIFIDACLCYFIFRGLISDIDDFRWLIKAFAILLIPYVALLFYEMITNHNLFSLLGGPIGFQGFRKGRIRCVGSFRESSLLGTVGASFMPLYIASIMNKNDRKWGLLGSILCTSIVLLSNSGGPIAAEAVAVLGWLLWPVRTRMRIFRRGVLFCLFMLSIFMKDPIWFLPAKISEITGGDGWHRSYLMDCMIRNFKEWWLWGMPIQKTEHWFPYQLKSTGAADITNQYVKFGLTGGLLAIILFIFLIIRYYQVIGKAMTFIRTSIKENVGIEFYIWGLGVMLTVHVINWLAIIYFDQTYVILYLQLAMIVNLSQTQFLFSIKKDENVKSQLYQRQRFGHMPL